jgi:preprotein translocase subunit SecD
MPASRRNALVLALGAIVCGFLFYKADSFWGVITCGLIALWALVGALPVMDGGWRFKTGLASVVLVGASIILWPTIDTMSGGRAKCPGYIRDNIKFGIVKGLDLQGGMRLVYTVEVEEAIRDKRDRFADDMRQELAVSYKFHSGDGVLTRDAAAKLDEKVHISLPESAVIRLKFTDPADMSKIDDRFNKKFGAEMTQQRSSTPGELAFKIRGEVETQIRERAVAQAKETVSKRVDEMGLREASVTIRDEDIIVEVPGQDQKAFDDIKEIIRKTARLEFKMVDDEGAGKFFNIPDKDVPEKEGIQIFYEQAPNGPGKSVEKAYYGVITRRSDDKGNFTESLGDTLKRFKAWTSTLNVPDDHQVGYAIRTENETDDVTGAVTTKEVGWRTYYLFSRAEVTGDYITDAAVAQDTNGGMGGYYVGITFSPAGADRFEEITGANVQKRFAIILDDTIDSAPVIKTKIAGGRASITLGAGDPETQLANARKLELVLRSGALPAPITPSNESMIGPSLGKDAIQQAVKGMLVGSSLVLVFMLFYYRKSGALADIAVLFNLFLQMAVLASFSATMTVPGIAGLALTLGMSVDVNVLINERIREELRAGRSIRAAVDAGYDKAFSSILDGHVTVFISGLILMQYGSGPVKGFAVTLLVGILASLFTGVFCTRLVFDWWVRHAKVKRLSVGAEF